MIDEATWGLRLIASPASTARFSTSHSRNTDDTSLHKQSNTVTEHKITWRPHRLHWQSPDDQIDCTLAHLTTGSTALVLSTSPNVLLGEDKTFNVVSTSVLSVFWTDSVIIEGGIRGVSPIPLSHKTAAEKINWVMQSSKNVITQSFKCQKTIEN